MVNLAARFYENVEKNPDKLALVVDGKEFSYRDLGVFADKIASKILEWKEFSSKELRIVVIGGRSPEVYASILGITAAGGAYIPISVQQPKDRIQLMLKRINPQIVILDDSASLIWTEKVLKDLGLEARILTNPSRLTTPGCRAWPVSRSSMDLAYILFTSGTTGIPKGVRVSVGNAMHFLKSAISYAELKPDDRLSQFFDLSFDTSIFSLFGAWEVGASVHVIPINQLYAPDRFIQKQKLTVWCSVPSIIPMMKRMGNLKRDSFLTLRLSIFVGEAFTFKSAMAWKQAAPSSVIENQYGPTEVTVNCLREVFQERSSQAQSWGTLPIGLPYPETVAELVDEKLNFILEKGKSESLELQLALSGPQVSDGYFEDPEETRKKFVFLNHPQLGSSRWYLTGDRVCRDDENKFHFLGRIDNQIKMMGRRIELEEIEFHLRDLFGSTSVAAVAWPVVNESIAGITAFVMTTGEVPSLEVILKEMKRRLPDYMIPKGWVLTKEFLPLNSNGKLDRKALVVGLESGKFSVIYGQNKT